MVPTTNSIPMTMASLLMSNSCQLYCTVNGHLVYVRIYVHFKVLQILTLYTSLVAAAVQVFTIYGQTGAPQTSYNWFNLVFKYHV